MKVELPNLAFLERLQILFPLIDAHSPHETTGASENAPESVIRVEVERTSALTVRADGVALATGLATGEALALVEHLIIRAIVHRSRSMLVLHAAAVSDTTGAAFLIGDGGSGKTTACVEMLRAGWDYLSDELGLVDIVSGVAVPFQRALLLKPDGWRRDDTPAIESTRRATVDDGRRYVHWDTIRPGSAGRTGAPIRRIHFLGRVPRASADAVHEIAVRCFNFHRVGSEKAWTAIADVVQASWT